MSRNWFVRQDGKIMGPCTAGSLKEMTATGRIERTADVSNSPDGPWHPITKVQGLRFPPEVRETTRPVAQPQVIVQRVPEHNQENEDSSETDVWKGNPSQITNLKTFILCGLFFWLIISIYSAPKIMT